MFDRSECIPSWDSLLNAYRCAWALNIQFSGEFNQPWKREQQLLPYFGAMVDAFHPIRPLLGSFVGWPYRIARATEDLIEVMDGLAAYWGWEGLNLTKAGREAEIERRIEEHSTRIADPLRVVALSWLALRPPLHPDLEAAEKYANEGRKRGLQPEILELDEAIQRFRMLLGEWNAGLRIGKVYPRLPDETPDGFHLRQTINHSLTVLHGFLEKEGTSPLRPWKPEQDLDAGSHSAKPQPEYEAKQPTASQPEHEANPDEAVDAGTEPLSSGKPVIALTVEEKALALAVRLETAGEPWGLEDLSKMIPITRTYLYKLPRFRAVWKSIQQERKNRKKNLRNSDAWQDREYESDD